MTSIKELLTRRMDMPAKLLIMLLGSLSVGSLLFYFHGLGKFAHIAPALLLIETCGLIFVAWWSVKNRREELLRRLVGGLWAGGLATVAYDVVRIPVAHSGIPVFKAISYFGTLLVGVESPTPLSEALGWAYHLSNGISFGLMYAAVVRKPRVYSAVIWGLMLEAVMLMTPYAEVFGYRRDAKFLAITIGAHVVYGLVLWLALLLWADGRRARLKPAYVTSGFLCAPVVIALIAADFYVRYARQLPPSPPPYIGPHLYTTWDVPEPDRVVAMWVMRRFVEPRAQFHFVKPFEAIKYGRPFDLPEASIRRHGVESATQFLVRQNRLDADARLRVLARMTYLTEVTPWMLASDPEAGRLAEQLRGAADRECGRALNPDCAERLFAVLDEIYEQP